MCMNIAACDSNVPHCDLLFDVCNIAQKTSYIT